MGFEKAFENKYFDLPIQTRYRFAEMELARAARILSPFYHHATMQRRTAIGTLFDMITPKYHRFTENEERFAQALTSPHNNQPPTEHQITYFIALGLSYRKIREITGTSFNSISKARFGLPFYQPMYQNWSEEMLLNWDQVSRSLNIWGEQLSHYKEGR